MHVSLALEPILSLVAGILVLVRPAVLNYVIGVCLILIGTLGILR